MAISRQLEEILSWRLVSEFWRRFPEEFVLIEAHPGGGQSDCLVLGRCDGSPEFIVSVNRGGGSTHVHSGRSPQTWENWADRMLAEPMDFLDAVTQAVGINCPQRLPSSTPTTVTFRFICEFLTHTCGRLEKWECRNGVCDTSGYRGGKRREWFTQFPV